LHIHNSSKSTDSSVKSRGSHSAASKRDQLQTPLVNLNNHYSTANKLQMQQTIGNQALIQLMKSQLSTEIGNTIEKHTSLQSQAKMKEYEPVTASKPANQLQTEPSNSSAVIQMTPGEGTGKFGLILIGSLLAVLGAVLVKKIFFSGESVPSSAEEWKEKLVKLDTKEEHTFSVNGDLIKLDDSLSLHYLKLEELVKKRKLSDLEDASQSAKTNVGTVGHEHELVKSGGERLRFEHHLNQEVDQFISDNVTDSHDQDKVMKFFVGSDTEKQDRMRFFDMVNDNVNSTLKKKASAYAAKKASNARLFANHYTYYVANNKLGSKLDSEVESDYSTDEGNARSEAYDKQDIGEASTEKEAIELVRKSSDALSFESIEAAVSHLVKHPMQDNNNLMKNYLSWARLAVKKGDGEASRNQFDAGWSLAFNYGGQLVNARLQEDGKAFLTSYTPQQSSYAQSAEAFHYEPNTPPGTASVISLKSQIEAVRKLINKDGYTANKTTIGVEEGADFAISGHSDITKITLRQGTDNDQLSQAGTEFTIMLNSHNKSALTDRVDFLWKQFQSTVSKTPMELQEKSTFLHDKLLVNAGKGSDYEELFNAYSSDQLGLDSSSSSYGDNFQIYADFVKTTIEKISKDIKVLMTELSTKKVETDKDIIALTEQIADLQTKVNDYQDKMKESGADKKAIGLDMGAKNKEKAILEQQKRTEMGAELEAQRKKFTADAKQMFHLLTIFHTKFLKDKFDKSGKSGSGGITINGDLIYHLITPQQVSPSSFRSSGISGGHHEQNLQMFLSLHPEYHFVEIKKIDALGTTLRLYKQYMWSKDERPPKLDDLTHRPTKDDPMSENWSEAGVKKGTAEDILEWLQQGKEAVDKWAEFDKDGPSSQRIGRALYESSPGEKAEDNGGVEFGGRLEYSKELNKWLITQLVPHVDWMMSQAGK
jgi:hypothetical protein